MAISVVLHSKLALSYSAAQDGLNAQIIRSLNLGYL
jgi:hypothetical protein